MTCRQAQQLITPYIKRQLDLDTEMAFVSHMKSCSACMEDLEVYHALLSAVEQLETNNEEIEHENDDLKLRMENTILRVKKRRQHGIVLDVVYYIIILVLCLLSGIGIGI